MVALLQLSRCVIQRVCELLEECCGHSFLLAFLGEFSFFLVFSIRKLLIFRISQWKIDKWLVLWIGIYFIIEKRSLISTSTHSPFLSIEHEAYLISLWICTFLATNLHITGSKISENVTGRIRFLHPPHRFRECAHEPLNFHEFMIFENRIFEQKIRTFLTACFVIASCPSGNKYSLFLSTDPSWKNSRRELN